MSDRDYERVASVLVTISLRILRKQSRDGDRC
jgi:hypothetical protein